MAEAWLRALRGDEFESLSAGVAPQGINPFAVQVMSEVGIDLGGQDSVHIDSIAADTLDTVITVCDHASDTCPALPKSVHVVHHPFDDPPHLAKSAKSLAEALWHYRRVRDEIRSYVCALEPTSA